MQQKMPEESESELELPSEKVLEFKCDVQHGMKYVVIGFVMMILAYYVLREVIDVRVKKGSWTTRKLSMMAQLFLSFVIGIATMVILQFLYRYLWKTEALKMYTEEWKDALQKHIENQGGDDD